MPVSSLRALRRPAFYAALCTILFIAGNSLPATASSAVSGVRPIELPGLPGALQSAVNGINNDGVLVGSSGTADEPLAVRWSPAGAITRLPMPSGATVSEALDINGTGVIVGYIDSRAVRWNPRSTITRLTVPAGLTESYAIAINDKCVTVGDALVAGSEDRYHALRWTTAGAVTELATLPGADNTVATSLSPTGFAGGYVDVGGLRHAVRWTPRER
jgi:uncharacterized membrane protein